MELPPIPWLKLPIEFMLTELSMVFDPIETTDIPMLLLGC